MCSDRSTETGAGDTTVENTIPKPLLSVLAEPIHRNVLSACRRRTETGFTINDLAEVVVRSSSHPGEADIDEIRLRLHHVILPKLDRVNLIEYAPGHGLVRVIAPSKIDDLLAASDQLKCMD